MHLIIGIHSREIPRRLNLKFILWIFVMNECCARDCCWVLQKVISACFCSLMLSLFPRITLEQTLSLSGGIMQSKSKWRANGALIRARSADIISSVRSMRHRRDRLTVIAEVRTNVHSLGIRNNSASFLRGIKRNWPETLASGDWTRRLALHVVNII